MTEISKLLAVLVAAKPTDSEDEKLKERQPLSFVVHFIGDVHQPFHAADRNGDRGGNEEHISLFGIDGQGKLVLHAIWNTQIVSRIDSTQTKLANDLKPEMKKTSGEPKTTPIKWAVQSCNYARDVACVDIRPPNGKTDVAELSQSY